VAAQQIHKSRLGVPNLLVLTVTTNETHMRSFMAALKELTNDGSTMFLFKAVQEFGCLPSASSPRRQIPIDAQQRVGQLPMSIAA
jgi:hypothetical protein